MKTGVWGKKIGMTQVFVNEKVVPVTVIDTSNWFITQIKNKELDGYNAIQIGCVKPKYSSKTFEKSWLTELSKYFSAIKEVKTSSIENLEVGSIVDPSTILQVGQTVDAMGLSKGRGFQGAVKRHGFRGGSGSHGDKTGRRIGSLSFMRSRGRVIKGKRLPGHMGMESKTIKNLELIQIIQENNVLLLKGSIPGKAGSLVFISKRG